MPSSEAIEIHFGDVFRYKNFVHYPDWVIIDVKSPLNPQFFFACPIIGSPGQEMLGWSSTETVQSIESIVDRWDPERVFKAYEQGLRYNFGELLDKNLEQILNGLREQSKKPPNLLIQE